jgi:hypothetical protein
MVLVRIAQDREHLVLHYSQTTSTHHIDSSGTAASLRSALGAGGRVVCEISRKRWEGLLSVVYNRDVDVSSYSYLLQKYYVGGMFFTTEFQNIPP